jgi:DNA-binding LacI/PurR family transcriptional regulator
MKKLLVALLVLAFISGALFAQAAKEVAPVATAKNFHIGVVTGTVSQSEDDLRGAERMIQEYGAVATGGMIQHVTYPDNFMDEAETTISVISGLADDPLMKAIIVNQAIPGTTEAFRRVKEKRADILCIAGEAHEDPGVIQSAADLAVNNDFVARGYLIIKTAHDLGVDTFVHISFPRHMSYETMSRRVAIMRATCAEFGMKFVLETAPDPTSDVGVAGAQQYVLEKVPAWIQQYGKNAAFFCTNDAHTEPLLKQLLAFGGFFIEADLPSPLMGYPGALGIDLSAEAGDFGAILKKVEASVVAKGGAGRFGTWAFSYGYTTTAGLVQHAINVVKGESELLKLADLMKAYAKFTPGAQWNGSFYSDIATGVRAKNHVLIYQDTYMMGKGFMGTPSVTIPDKYFVIK